MICLEQSEASIPYLTSTSVTAAHRDGSEGGAGLGVAQTLGEARQSVVLGVEKSTERLGQRREARQGGVHHHAGECAELLSSKCGYRHHKF